MNDDREVPSSVFYGKPERIMFIKNKLETFLKIEV